MSEQVRKQDVQGVVTSDKMDKTIVVEVEDRAGRNFLDLVVS